MRSLLSSGPILALITVLVCGCGGGESEVSNGTDAEQVDVKKVDAESLPKLADYLPPLPPGENLIEVAPPDGWSIKQKSAAYLCAFTKEKGGQVPAIVVKQGKPGVEGFDDVTEENVADFAAALNEQLNGESGGQLLEEVRPMQIGPNSFARYVKKAALDGLPAEVQMLVTHHKGRLFQIELRVRPSKEGKDLVKHRDASYAVAAGLKFPSGTKEASPMPIEPAAPSTPEPAKAAE